MAIALAVSSLCADRPQAVIAPNALPIWRLRKVQRFIDAHVDAPLRLADLAAVAGLSRMYFAAQFRAATGQRPHDYVLSRRVARAKTLMASSNGTLVNIALDTGFQSQAHFCTVFRRFTGVTPTAWRRETMVAGHLSLGISSGLNGYEAIPAAPFLPLIPTARDVAQPGY